VTDGGRQRWRNRRWGGGDARGAERSEVNQFGAIRSSRPLNWATGKLGALGGELGIGPEFHAPIPSTTKQRNWSFWGSIPISRPNSMQPDTA
jgi:hypothetical protein